MKQNKNRGIRDFFILCIVGGILLFVIGIAIYLRPHLDGDLSAALQIIFGNVVGLVLGVTFCISIFAALVIFIGSLNYSAIETALESWASRTSEKIRVKNANAIYPWLRLFLYNILEANRGTLNLTLGQDASCLTPYVNVRKNCAIYGFSIVSAHPPEMDCATLRQLIQQFILVELGNYGIPGLPALFRDAKLGTFYTVYLDRVRYVEKQHLLHFELIFIASTDAAQYFLEAEARDKTEVEIEPEVYDDDLQ